MQFRIREFWENAAFISCDLGSNVNRVFLKSDAVTNNAAKVDQCLDDSNLLLLQTSLPFLRARTKRRTILIQIRCITYSHVSFIVGMTKSFAEQGGNSGR